LEKVAVQTPLKLVLHVLTLYALQLSVEEKALSVLEAHLQVEAGAMVEGKMAALMVGQVAIQVMEALVQLQGLVMEQ